MKTNSGGRRLHINNSFLSFRIKAEINPSPTPLCLTKEMVSCKKKPKQKTCFSPAVDIKLRDALVEQTG